MDILSYRALLSESQESGGVPRRLPGEGFVDEAVVSAMIARGVYGRAFDQHGSLALSSNEDDYAGWHLPATPADATVAPPDFHLAWRENSLVTSASPG